MALIPTKFDEVIEMQNATPGRYDLTISAAEITLTKEQQKRQIRVSVGVDGHDNVQNITHFVGIPGEKDTADAATFKALLLKRFCSLFGVPLSNSGVDDEALAMSMVGARAKSVEVGLSEPDKNNGAVYNRIVVPKLKGEGSPRAAGVAKPPRS